MSTILDTLQNVFKTVQEKAGAYGVDMSNDRTKAEGYSIALSSITGTPWETAYSPEKGAYLVYPRDLAAARAWAAAQASKKSTVSVQWWPSVQPLVMKAVLPYAIGLVAAGYITAKVLK